MNHRATPRFWSCYRRLPEEIQRLADRAQQLDFAFADDGPFGSIASLLSTEQMIPTSGS